MWIEQTRQERQLRPRIGALMNERFRRLALIPIDEMRLVTAGAPVAGALAILTSLVAAAASSLDYKTVGIQFSITSATCALLALIFTMATLAAHRRLDPMQRAVLVAKVRQLPPVPAVVFAPQNDREARAYARLLLGVLREGGWPVKGVFLDDTDDATAIDGVVFAFRDKVSPPPGSMELYFCLQLLGIRVATAESDQAPDGGFELFVGRRA
jgi:hypothetical protein